MQPIATVVLKLAHCDRRKQRYVYNQTWNEGVFEKADEDIKIGEVEENIEDTQKN